MSDGRKKANNSDVKTPVECCPKPTIDLEYLDCHGKGIAGAKYQVYSVNWDGKKDGKFSKSGTLDGNGQAHIANVPEIKALKYYFEKDPKPYKPELVPSKTPDREEAVSMLDSIAIWLVGTAQGDFNKEQTIGQITVNALLGLIPVVDQALDARDLTAGLKAIIDYYMEDEADQQKHPDEIGIDYEKWIWINVFIISIGCIPIVGSAVKGVLKGVIHYLKQAGKVAGKLSPNQLRKGWEFLVAILNKFGVGNAHKWLSTEFPSKIDGWMAKASDTIRGGLDTIKQTADKAVAGVSFFSSTKAAELAERAKAYKKGIDKAKSKVDEMANQVKSWFKEQLQTLTGGAHKSEKMGATGTKGRPIQNQREQIAAEAPDSNLPTQELNLFDRIRAMEKGTRPDPKTYMSENQVKLHAQQFEGGASRLMLKGNLEKYGPAQRDGTAFVMPKKEIDKLLLDTKGDKRALERALGLPEGMLDSDQLVRVDIPDPKAANIRIPSGNEAGANSKWLPGGKLPEGNFEAVVDLQDAPKGTWTVTPINN